MLAKLDIFPIEIGIILTGAIEDGFLFPASSLDIDIDQVRSDIITATSGAFNLACNVQWFAKEIRLPCFQKQVQKHYQLLLKQELLTTQRLLCSFHVLMHVHWP